MITTTLPREGFFSWKNEYLNAYSDSTDTWTGTMTGPVMLLGDYVAPGMTHENMMWDLEQWVICGGE